MKLQLTLTSFVVLDSGDSSVSSRDEDPQRPHGDVISEMRIRKATA
jgi:hypothetical protein